MDAILAWLAMGGYGVFVWGAYGAAAVLLVGLLVLSRRALRRQEMALATSELASRRARRP